MTLKQNDPYGGGPFAPKPVCGLPPVALRPLPVPIDPRRARLIRNAEKKWVNGSVLHFHFMAEYARLPGIEAQWDAVRGAFEQWRELGVGLTFREVSEPGEAEIRIGFDDSDGSWAYVGRDAIDYAPNPAQKTVNYGWDLTTPYGRDTALHEIGHVLGFPHEHQNPRAGIVWNESAVYTYFAGPPNNWPRDTTYYNIVRKLDPGEVEGSRWDRDSIMHYQFGPGLILQPEEFRDAPLVPEPGLSQVDIDEVQRFYPPLAPQQPELKVWELARIQVQPGEQLNWVIRPTESRTYTIDTFGRLDTVMVLFESVEGEPRYVAGDDDSGADRNARLVQRLVRGREYVLRLRLYSSDASGGGAVLLH